MKRSFGRRSKYHGFLGGVLYKLNKFDRNYETRQKRHELSRLKKEDPKKYKEEMASKKEQASKIRSLRARGYSVKRQANGLVFARRKGEESILVK